MYMTEKSELQHYVSEAIHDLSHEPGFPTDYCNVASKHLFDILQQSWKSNIRIQHSYREPWDWHTYVVLTQEDWTDIILDPTYSQYDPRYEDWFIWKHFPDKTLEKNRTEPEDFIKKQKKRFNDWMYDKLRS